eukprot:gene7714-9035_t
MGVTIEVLKPGNGSRPTKGMTVWVHYTGTLQNGKQFDSSRGGEPFAFRLGMQDVIEGWDMGVIQMSVGERSILTITPDMAYGDEDDDDIPAGSTLLFDVELIKFK